MSLKTAAIRFAERHDLPDWLVRRAIAHMVAKTARKLAAQPADPAAFSTEMGARVVAEHADAANAQHYALPPEFFAATLGPARKYSSCLYPRGDESLAMAEDAALRATMEHAALADGQDILELGCGWGSLTLSMTRALPHAHITAVSNSAPQRAYIEGAAAARGLTNVAIITADMNDFTTDARFDRVVSVEMFEHMANWGQLLSRISGWLKPESGRLFIHIFSHLTHGYRFDHGDAADWIGQYFFTGGIMPSHDLMAQFDAIFEIEESWRWNGENYARTARQWLANFDANHAAISPILRDVYGDDADIWRRRWRFFYLATEGLFDHGGGEPWAVSHYRLKPR